MYPAETFRGFVNKRLAAAAEEIFGAFVKCIREYQEEIDRQRSLLGNVCKPEIMSPRIELQEQDVCMAEALTERNLSMGPELPTVKEEPGEVCTSQEGGLLVFKEETDILMRTPTYEESDNDEDQTLDLYSDETLSAAQEESAVNRLVISSVVGELHHLKPLFNISHVADSQVQKGQHENPGSSGDTESKSSNEQHKGKSHDKIEYKQAMTQTNMKREEEIDPQSRLLDVAWKPIIKLYQIELPQKQVSKAVEGLTDKEVCNQERKSTIDRQDPHPPQAKEQQEEVCASQEERQLELKVDSDAFMMTLINGNNQDQTPDLNANESLSSPQKESVDRNPVIDSVVEAPNGDVLLSNNSPVAESPDQKVEPRGKNLKFKRKCRDRNKTGEKSHNCKKCGRHFRQSSVLSIHMRTHTGEKPYICKTCGKCFRHNSSLKAHMRTHTGEKPYTCKTCGKLFRQRGQMKIHMRIHTGEQPYFCETCGQNFTHVNALKVHMRTHTGEKPCVCKVCGERFRQCGQLTNHVRKAHTGQKPYVCETCGKNFIHVNALKVHMRTHTGEKPCVCKICGEHFRQCGQLIAHLRKAHSGEQPYVCETCGENFTQVNALKVHMRTHTGEKRCVCKICGERFRQSCQLKTHVRKAHTGKKPYVCKT